MPAVNQPDKNLQYALMLKLPSTTVQRVKAVQDEFAAFFPGESFTIKYPHMTLMSCFMDPVFEDRISLRMEKLAAEVPVQPVRLSGFEFLTKAFCIKVENGGALFGSVFRNPPFLRKRLRMEAQVSGIEFVSHPHVTVARRLTDDQLRKAGEEWQSRRFYHEFEASGVVLLRYPKDRGSMMVSEFTFKGKGNEARSSDQGIQTSLF